MITKFLYAVLFVTTLLSTAAMAQTTATAQVVYYEHRGDLVQVDCQPRKPELAQAWQELCADIDRRLTQAGFAKQHDLSTRWNSLNQHSGPVGCSVYFMITSDQNLVPLPVCYYGDPKRGQEVLINARLVMPRT